MSLTLHLIKKDARRLAWPLALWLALIAADLGLGVWLTHGTALGWGMFGLIEFGHKALVGMQAALTFVLTAQMVQEDPVDSSRAFWITRPISRARLLGAKLLWVVGLLWLLPLLLLLPWWLSSGLGFGDLTNVVLETIVRQAALTLPVMVLAGVTRRLGSFLVWLAAISALLIMSSFMLQLIVPGLPAHPSPAEANLMRWKLAALLAFWLAIGAHQFLTGARRQTLWLLGLWGVAVIELVGLNPWDLSDLFLPDQSAGETSNQSNFASAMMRPATEVTGFGLSLEGARVLNKDFQQYVQLQLVLDQAEPLRIAFPEAAETTWSWPDNRDLAPRRITLPAGGYVPEFGVMLQAAIITQLLPGNTRVTLPLDLMEQAGHEVQWAGTTPSPSQEFGFPTIVPAQELLAGSRHAVATKVKLAVWEVSNLMDVPLRVGGHTPRAARQLRVLVLTREANLGQNGSETLFLTLVGHGPAPARTLLGGFINEGAWPMPDFSWLVNRAKPGFVPVSSQDGLQQIRIGGVGITLERFGFRAGDFHLPGTQMADPLSVGARAPSRAVRDAAVPVAQFDPTWLADASVMVLDLKPLGWVRREASNSDLRVPDYVGLRSDLAAATAAWSLVTEIWNPPTQTALYQPHPELGLVLNNVLNRAFEVKGDPDNKDPVATAQSARDFTTALDDALARLDVIAQSITESPATVTQARQLEEQLTAVKRKLP